MPPSKKVVSKEEVKKEEVKKEEVKKEEVKKEEVKKVVPKKETKKKETEVSSVDTKETKKTDETKKDETKTDETKKEETEEKTVIATLSDKISNLQQNIKDIQLSFKVLVKEFDKQQKIIDKVQKKRENARKSPSGFAKPNKISDELCDFIGVPHGTEKSRTEVTRIINAYVKEHDLNNPKNRRIIEPDAKLKAILNIKNGEEVNFFILQKLISHHFPLSISKMNANAIAEASKVK